MVKALADADNHRFDPILCRMGKGEQQAGRPGVPGQASSQCANDPETSRNPASNASCPSTVGIPFVPANVNPAAAIEAIPAETRNWPRSKEQLPAFVQTKTSPNRDRNTTFSVSAARPEGYEEHRLHRYKGTTDWHRDAASM
jgi:hypothetical protein